MFLNSTIEFPKNLLRILATTCVLLLCTKVGRVLLRRRVSVVCSNNIVAGFAITDNSIVYSGGFTGGIRLG